MPRAKFRMVKLLLIKQGVISSTNRDNPAVAEAKELCNVAATAGDYEAQFQHTQAYLKFENRLFDMGSTTDGKGIGTTHAGRKKPSARSVQK